MAKLRVMVLLFLTLFSEVRPQTTHPETGPLGFEFSYIIDTLSNVAGGIERGTDVMGSLILSFTLDGEEALGWKGAEFEASILGVHGRSFSEKVGDFQTVSNIEAPSTVNLFSAYYQQSLLKEKLRFQIGLLNIDSDFDVRESSELFVHSSPGTGGDIGQLGTNGPGIFPVGALGGRVSYQDRGWYGQLAVVEGQPGDPDDPFGTTLKLDRTEGTFLIGEIGKIWSDEYGPLGKVALGAWGFTAGFPTHQDPTASASNRGAYLSLEKAFLREDDPIQGLTGYLRVGTAEGRINPIETYLGAGLIYTGVFPGRDQDRVGLAFNTGFSGRDYLNSGSFDSHETALELTYSFAVNDSFTIQPDIIYVINPGFDPSLENSLILGLRATWAFSL